MITMITCGSRPCVVHRPAFSLNEILKRRFRRRNGDRVMATSFYKERVRVNAWKALVGATVAAGVLTSVILPNPCLAIAQTDPSQPSPSIVAGVALRGTVIDSSGGLAVDATV